MKEEININDEKQLKVVLDFIGLNKATDDMLLILQKLIIEEQIRRYTK